jgi:hypothetical protein
MVRDCVRHAASFAALAWYLMVPPVGKTGHLNLNVAAPYSLWRTYRIYDTKKQCDVEQIAIVVKVNALLREPENKRYADLIKKDATSTPQNSTDVLNARGFLGSLLARCVSADDPSLKSK